MNQELALKFTSYESIHLHFIALHPSSFRLHPLHFPPRAEEFLHNCAALFLQNAGCDFNSMIQKIGITNPKS